MLCLNFCAVSCVVMRMTLESLLASSPLSTFRLTSLHTTTATYIPLTSCGVLGPLSTLATSLFHLLLSALNYNLLRTPHATASRPDTIYYGGHATTYHGINAARDLITHRLVLNLCIRGDSQRAGQ